MVGYHKSIAYSGIGLLFILNRLVSSNAKNTLSEFSKKITKRFEFTNKTAIQLITTSSNQNLPTNGDLNILNSFGGVICIYANKTYSYCSSNALLQRRI